MESKPNAQSDQMSEKSRDSAPSAPVLVWFRDDLRVADHPALAEAVHSKRPVIALYVLDETSGLRPLGGAARWWLAGSIRRDEWNGGNAAEMHVEDAALA